MKLSSGLPEIYPFMVSVLCISWNEGSTSSLCCSGRYCFALLASSFYNTPSMELPLDINGWPALPSKYKTPIMSRGSISAQKFC